MKPYLLISLLALILTACGAEAPPTAAPNGPTAMVPVVAVSELEVGQNRLPLGILANGTPINDPALKLKLRFYYLDGAEPSKVLDESEAIYRGEGLPFGIYVAYPNLDRAGGWGVEVEIPQASGAPQTSRLRLDVLERSKVPAVGSAAIASQNATIRDVSKINELTSDPRPDPALYQLSIADALAAQKPFLVTFSTPGYCQTAVCGPNMLVVKKLKETYGQQVNFLHVEVYPFPFSESFQQQRRVPAMAEWNLRTEPWTFLVDGQGIIQAKYEGGITFAELEPALVKLAIGVLKRAKATIGGAALAVATQVEGEHCKTTLAHGRHKLDKAPAKLSAAAAGMAVDEH